MSPDGYWDPAELNGFGGANQGRGSNSLQMLGFLAAAHAICDSSADLPRPKNGKSFGDSLVELVRTHGYDFNMQLAHTTTPTCLFATYVDRLSWLSHLMIMDYTPELVWAEPDSNTARGSALGLTPQEKALFRERFAASVLAYWNSTSLSAQTMRLGLWDALVQLLLRSDSSGLHDNPEWMLQRWPTELVNWPVQNSQRLDVGVDQDFARSCSATHPRWEKPSRALPPDESVLRDYASFAAEGAWALDSPGGQAGPPGLREETPTTFLLEYWFKRRVGILGAPKTDASGGARAAKHDDAAPYVSRPTRLYTHGDAGFVCIRIPATALLADGSLLSVAGGRCFTGDSCFPSDDSTRGAARNFSSMIARRSTTGGADWSEISVVVDAKKGLNGSDPTCTKSDPALVVDLLHSRVHLFYTNPIGVVWRTESRDRKAQVLSRFASTRVASLKIVSALEEGFSWAPAVVVPIGPVCHSPPAPVCASHIAPGTGIQLSSAHPLHPGRLLIVAIVEEKSLLNRVLRSDDGGSSWLPSNSIEDCGEAQLAELGDAGSIYMNCRVPKSKAFAGGLDRGRSVSTDGKSLSSVSGTLCLCDVASH